MEQLCRFGPVTVQFQDIPRDSLWPFWSWKLDPFTVKEGTPDLTVRCCGQPVYPTGTPVWEDPGMVCRQMFVLADGTVVWQQTDRATGRLQLQFLVSADWSEITLTRDCSPTAGMGAFESLTFLIYYAFLHRQVLTFHGALVEEGGRGFLLCADSGVGKTTHARLWRDHKNALILNGDRAACYQKQGQWLGFGTPWCGTSGEYVNRAVPLRAVVILERGEENHVSAANGMWLLAHTVYPAWDQAATETMLSLLDRFLSSVPVLKLECTPHVSSVEVLYQALENFLYENGECDVNPSG